MKGKFIDEISISFVSAELETVSLSDGQNLHVILLSLPALEWICYRRFFESWIQMFVSGHLLILIRFIFNVVH